MICPRLLIGALVEWFRHIKSKADTYLSGMSYNRYHHDQ